MAIPKVIHYCWLSGDPYPELVRKCLNSWHEKLPGYDFVLWDRRKVDSIANEWVRSAMAQKKWAFAADYVRLYALYNYGGVYLDCDVEVVKPLDELLKRKFFLGRESHNNVIEAAVLGAESHLSWVKCALEWYGNRDFDVADLNNPKIAVPVILKNVLDKESNVEIFAADYFSPKDNRTGRLKVSQNTFTIHHFDGNWFDDYQREYFRIRQSYSVKYGSFVGLVVATLFSIVHKVQMKFFK